jgi:hypothetical protein
MILRGENPDGDRQIEAWPLLFDISRGEIDGRSPDMGSETGIADGGMDPVLALLHDALPICPALTSISMG